MVYVVLTPRCFAYRHAATTFYQLQRGFGGSRQNARIQGFLSVLFSLSLFYSLQRGSNGLIAEKTILILYQGSRGGQLFSRGGVKLFPGGRGPNANFFRNPFTYLIFSRGVSGPPTPLWIRTWAMSSYRDNIYHSPASNHNCQALICQD